MKIKKSKINEQETIIPDNIVIESSYTATNELISKVTDIVNHCHNKSPIINLQYTIKYIVSLITDYDSKIFDNFDSFFQWAQDGLGTSLMTDSDIYYDDNSCELFWKEIYEAIIKNDLINLNLKTEDDDELEIVKDDLYNWTCGNSYKNSLSKTTISYIKSHLESSTDSFYRVETQGFTIKNNVKIGDIITFGRYRSFAKGENGFNSVYGDFMSCDEYNCICLKTQGKVNIFDVYKYITNPEEENQQEVLIKGKFKIIDISTIETEWDGEEIPLYIIQSV